MRSIGLLVLLGSMGMFPGDAWGRDVSQAFVPRLLKSTTELAKKPVKWAQAVKERKQVPNEVKVELRLSPETVKLAETRQIQASLLLTNYTKSLVQFEFPTTQRIEVAVRDAQGNTLLQWSEDQKFADERGFVTINPGEHVEYKAALATRDMKPGQLYTIEAFLPKYPNLRTQRLLTPQ